MKINETIKRECCEPRDLVRYRGVLQPQIDDLYFCRHCGEIWVLVVQVLECGETDTGFHRLFELIEVESVEA